jgi:hypothetical protein
MLVIGILLVLVTGTILSAASASDDPWLRAPIIIKAANSWQPGNSVPQELRRYRESATDMPTPMDSLSLVSKVTNLPLLSLIATDLSADPECREDAFTQGMYIGGPTKFFELVKRDLSLIQGRRSAWLTTLSTRMAQPHVVVDALFIDDEDMPREQVIDVLDRIERSLQDGGRWDAVYENYADEFGYKIGNRTKIGNLGHFVVFRDPQLGRGHYVDNGPNTISWQGEELPRRLWRLSYFDASHLSMIVGSAPGAIVRLHSSDYHQFVLYQVQEVYSGVR